MWVDNGAMANLITEPTSRRRQRADHNGILFLHVRAGKLHSGHTDDDRERNSNSDETILDGGGLARVVLFMHA